MAEMIKCPGCDLELPEDDVRAQVRHMQQKHPEIGDERRLAAGFRLVDGKWVDTLASDD